MEMQVAGSIMERFSSGLLCKFRRTRGPAAMPRLTVIDPPPTTAMERLVGDYLDYHRGMGHSIRTTRDAYGYPLRTLLLPFSAAEGGEHPSPPPQRPPN